MPLLRPLLVAALLLLIPASAQAAAGLELGVQDDAVVLDRHYGDAGLALDRAADLGAERVRVNLIWSRSMPLSQAKARLPPEVVAWDFSSLERLYQDATARGLRLQVTLSGSAPRWATGNRKLGVVRPKPHAFARFARAVADRFVGRIDRYSIWNEPNWHSRLKPVRSAPAIYRSLYAKAYDAIKLVDPTAQVLFGELMPGANSRQSTPALEFLRAVACVDRGYRRKRSCPSLLADGFALHPYNFARRPSKARNANRDIVEMGSLSRLTGALDRLARVKRLRTPSGAPMPVFLTEFGYFTAGPLRRSPKQHASWLAEAWRIAARNPRVMQLLQYGLIDPWPKQVTWRTAILKRDGTPRPAYFALQKLAR